MFLKGLLFGIGFVVGTGLVTTIILGVMVLIHVAENLAAIFKARKPEKSEHAQKSHRAKMSFLVRFPSNGRERVEMFERETEYLQ